MQQRKSGKDMTLTEARKLCRHAAGLLEKDAEKFADHERTCNLISCPVIRERDDLLATARALRELARKN
jgi:hypothetical protein